MSDQEVLPEISHRAQELFAKSGNCAQSAFAALAEHLELESDSTLKALTPFPGIALRGETCGAVVGSVMAIGMVLGRDRLDDQSGMQQSLATARRFCRAFESRFGGTSCRVILEQALGEDLDLASPEGLAAYLQAGGHQHCSEVVGHSVSTTAEMIHEAADGP